MRTLRAVFATFTLLFMTLFGTGLSFSASAEEDVEAVYTAWSAAFNKGDASAVAALYADDALFLPVTHAVIAGPAGVETYFSKVFGVNPSGHKHEIIEVREVGDVVYAAAKWSADGKDSDGNDQAWGGVATHVFERQSDGTLELKLHIFN